MLRRVIALLVALAVLAERTAIRCWAVRCLVLWFLRRAEAAARDFVLGETGAPTAMEPFAVIANDCDEALALAERFRALAAMLCALLPDPCPFVRATDGRGVAFGKVGCGSGRAPDGWRLEPNDTS